MVTYISFAFGSCVAASLLKLVSRLARLIPMSLYESCRECIEEEKNPILLEIIFDAWRKLNLLHTSLGGWADCTARSGFPQEM